MPAARSLHRRQHATGSRARGPLCPPPWPQRPRSTLHRHAGLSSPITFAEGLHRPSTVALATARPRLARRLARRPPPAFVCVRSPSPRSPPRRTRPSGSDSAPHALAPFPSHPLSPPPSRPGPCGHTTHWHTLHRHPNWSQTNHPNSHPSGFVLGRVHTTSPCPSISVSCRILLCSCTAPSRRDADYILPASHTRHGKNQLLSDGWRRLGHACAHVRHPHSYCSSLQYRRQCIAHLILRCKCLQVFGTDLSAVDIPPLMASNGSFRGAGSARCQRSCFREARHCTCVMHAFVHTLVQVQCPSLLFDKGVHTAAPTSITETLCSFDTTLHPSAQRRPKPSHDGGRAFLRLGTLCPTLQYHNAPSASTDGTPCMWAHVQRSIAPARQLASGFDPIKGFRRTASPSFGSRPADVAPVVPRAALCEA